MPEIFHNAEPLVLESGQSLVYHLAYTTYGQMNASGDNVIWIFHALTANSNPDEWWPGLVGNGKIFDPEKYFIVCVNMPGSCYGSVGPLDINPQTGAPWYHDFPFFTTRDMIRSYQALRRHLGITAIHIGIGGSMGGQQLLEWATEEPALFEYIIPVATNARHSPWAIAFNASQRLCIETDETWQQKDPLAGIKGMKTARSVALISYRHYQTYQLGQQETTNELISGFRSDSYQRYQGEKLAKRFNAFSYYKLSQSMDSHNIGRHRDSVEKVLQRIKARTVVIGIQSDILFPLQDQQLLADHIKGATFAVIDSLYGHDGFLLEYEQIGNIIQEYIQKPRTAGRKRDNAVTVRSRTDYKS